MSSRFSVPRFVLPRRPTADLEASASRWLRAMPFHAALLVGAAGLVVVAVLASSPGWLALASALAIAPYRLRRSLRAARPDTPLVAAHVRGHRAHVLELRASSSGWRPTVLDARVLSRRGLGPDERAIGWLVPHRGGYAFMPLAALTGAPGGLADPGRMPAGYFSMLARLSRRPHLEHVTDFELAEVFGMRVRPQVARPPALAA